MIPSAPPSCDPLVRLRDRWQAAWPEALETWSRFTRLRPPLLCLEHAAAQREGLEGSFAMIRLQDQAVVVSLPFVRQCGLEDFAREILAHEVGHHVLAPANLTDHARMIARMRWALPTREVLAPRVANLYTDLLINDRLQRDAGLRQDEVFRILGAREARQSPLWDLYLRIYELLWALPRGALGGNPVGDSTEGDAWLGARLVRHFSRDWLEGSGRFAALLLPYLLQDLPEGESAFAALHDTRHAAAGGSLAGLAEEEPGERSGAIHPAADPVLADLPEEDQDESDAAVRQSPSETPQNPPAPGQNREPFQYGEILRAAGMDISDHEAAIRFYRERAQAHLVPFPTRPVPEGADPLPEGLEPWDIGDALDEADWFQSILQSPRPIPGMTTVRRVWGTAEGCPPVRQPLDLDLYVDSSGSMPNPQVQTSYPALAGAILALSALRVGARVQATLWSGAGDFTSTPGFVRTEREILGVLTGYLGGGTAFPIHQMRDTFAHRPPGARPVHILVISDDGVTTMFDSDENGQSGWVVSNEALRRAGGGGTLVLNLPDHWETRGGPCADLRRARDEFGWQVHRVSSLADLVEFARRFSRHHYASASGGRQPRRAP